jgi:hypothetical protein
MSALVGSLAPNYQMHYREGQTRRCDHGPGDGNPADKTPGGTELEAAGTSMTPAAGLKRETSSGLPTRSTAWASAATGRAERNVSATRSFARCLHTVAAPKAGAKTMWTILLIMRCASLAKGGLFKPVLKCGGELVAVHCAINQIVTDKR